MAAKRLRPKTYSVALYLVGLVAAIELIAWFSVFYLRHVVSIDITAPPLRAQTVDTQVPGKVRPAEAPVNPPERIAPVPVPGRLAVVENQTAAERVKALNEEALRFETQGDLRLAALALFKAESLDPRDPPTLAALARLYSQEKEFERSKNYWQRIVDLGPGSGAIYNEARTQLATTSTTASLATVTPALPASPASSVNPANVVLPPPPQPLPPPVTDVAAASAPSPQHVLFVDKVEKTVTSSNEFALKIPLTVRSVSGAPISSGKVAIQLYCYEQQASGAIVPNKGTFKAGFLRKPGEAWPNGSSEILVANYLLTPEQARIYNQKYYGYMLRIYYDGKLQYERAEPDNLLKFFPAST